MKMCKITVLRTTFNRELAEEFGAQNLTPCPILKEGQVFYAGRACPEGFCPDAWQSVSPYVSGLARLGSENDLFFEEWIRKPGVAICSCADGLRPVIFKIERTEQEADSEDISAGATY